MTLQHQPLSLGQAAAEELLRFLGFEEVTRGDNETVTQARPIVYRDTFSRALRTATAALSPSFFRAAIRRATALPFISTASF